MTTELMTSTLRSAAALRIRLSAQGESYVLRHKGQRHVLTQLQAEGLISTVAFDLRAEGARWDDHGPARYGVDEWVQDFLLTPIIEDEPSEDEGFDPISAAARYNEDPENCSAADEDAAWFMMTSRGGW